MTRKTHKIICVIITIILLIAVLINFGIMLFGYLQAVDVYKISRTQDNYNAMKLIEYSTAFNSLVLFLVLMFLIGMVDIVYFIRNKIHNKKYIYVFIVYIISSSLFSFFINVLARMSYEVLFYITLIFMTFMMVLAIELRKKIGVKNMK